MAFKKQSNKQDRKPSWPGDSACPPNASNFGLGTAFQRNGCCALRKRPACLVTNCALTSTRQTSMDKKDGTIVIHCTKTEEILFKRLAERDGLTASERGYRLMKEDIDRLKAEYEFMKSLFDPDQ